MAPMRDQDVRRRHQPGRLGLLEQGQLLPVGQHRGLPGGDLVAEPGQPSPLGLGAGQRMLADQLAECPR